MRDRGFGIGFRRDHRQSALVGDLLADGLAAVRGMNSRFGMRLVLERSSDADVSCILDAWVLTTKKIKKVCAAISNHHHGLREVTKTICMAQVLADGASEDVASKHIDAAYKRLSSGGTK